VPKIFLGSTFFKAILLVSLVLLKVQKQFTNAIKTPIALKENPDDHNDCDEPALRTVFANVKITALMMLRVIWNHLKCISETFVMLQSKNILIVVEGFINAHQLIQKQREKS
jgi:hypothetical protein